MESDPPYLMPVSDPFSEAAPHAEDMATYPAKSRAAMKTISEVADILELPTHVLRFWETKFPQLQPLKRGGGRRFYRPEDIEALFIIKELLHQRGYTIKGAAKVLPDLMRERAAGQVSPLPAAEAHWAGESSLAHIERMEDMIPEGPAVPHTHRQALLALRQELEAIRALLA